MDNKPENKFKENIILVVLGVTLLVALLNIKTVASAAGTMIGLVMPLIAGGIIAFILNVPMNFFERKIDWLDDKYHCKPRVNAECEHRRENHHHGRTERHSDEHLVRILHIGNIRSHSCNKA